MKRKSTKLTCRQRNGTVKAIGKDILEVRLRADWMNLKYSNPFRLR